MFAAEAGEELEDLGLDGDVEGGGGLVCNEQGGAVEEGHGDEDALALAAGELVGVVAEAALGVGEGDFFEGGDGAEAEFAAREGRLVGLEAFGELAADGHDGVEGGHGLLKDHGDFAAAEGAPEVRGLAEEFAALPEDGAGDLGGGAEEAEDGERGDAFAGAGFADEAEDLAGGEGEGDAVDDLRGADGDAEVAEREEGCRGGLARVGSSGHGPIVRHWGGVMEGGRQGLI